MTQESGITDPAQIKRDRRAVRFFGAAESAPILAQYGLSKQELVSYGGRVIPLDGAALAIWRRDVDLIIGNIDLANSVVGRLWLEASVLLKLRFLDLPDPLVERLSEKDYFHLDFIPHGYVRGVDRDVRSVARPYLLVYTRDDAPDEFVRTLAEEYERNRHYFRDTHVHLSYDPLHVALHSGIPLHPAAREFYRERGYPVPA